MTIENVAHGGQHGDDCPVCNVWRDVNAILDNDPELADSIFGHETRWRWRYYGQRGALNSKPDNVYCYTTETIKHKGRPRYASYRMRYLKGRQEWRRDQTRYHAKKKDAKARALSLYGKTLSVS